MPEPPRTLVVTTWFPDSEAPSRTPFCLEHALAVQSSGRAVEVVHVALGRHVEPRREVYAGLVVHRLGLRPPSVRSWLRMTLYLRRLLATADVLHTMAFSSILVAAPAWFTRHRCWVHTEHWNGVTDPASVGRWWGRLSFLRYALRLPHRVTGVTAQLSRAMEPFARLGAVRTVPCVVEADAHLEQFPPAAPLRVVGVGHLIARKDPLAAIETIRWLVDRGVELHYVWVGDGPLRGDVQARVDALDLQEVVRLVGAVRPDEVRNYVRDAHLFFVPSRQENFFTAAAEAIASGRPAVIPAVGGVTDYCNDTNSVLVETRSAESFGEAILAIATTLRSTSPVDVAATVKSRFSRDAIGDMFARIYDELTAGERH